MIEVSRIEENIKTLGEEFVNKIYVEDEIVYSEKKNVHKYQSYAVRFAAKEAIFKAISKKLDNKYEVSFKDAWVVNSEAGRPEVAFSQKVEEIFAKKGYLIESMDISLSHLSEYAIASFSMVLTKKEEKI